MGIEIEKRGVFLVCDLREPDAVEAFRVLQDEGFKINLLHVKDSLGLDNNIPYLYCGQLSFNGISQIDHFAKLAGSIAREMVYEEEEPGDFRIPRECFFAADLSELDAVRAIEAIQTAGFQKKVLHVPGYENCDFSQPHFYCGEYSKRGADAIIDFVQRVGNRKEWREAS
ncbi:MAG: hypothetical protein Q7S53_05350 [bacterium]|nr:hypothetical protein [bacterium]